MADMIQLVLNNLYLIGVLALTTMGVTLTFKTVNVANFAQAMTSVIGAFTAAYLMRDLGWGIWACALGGIAVSFVIGLIIDGVIIRNIAGGNGRIMVTIGLIVLLTAAIPLVFGMVPYNFSRFFTGNLDFALFGMALYVNKNALFILGVSAAVISIIALSLRFTKWGLGIRATASNIYVASMMGVNTDMMTTVSWAISSACGALAAIFYASQTTTVSIFMLATIEANALLAFVVGSITSFWGPPVAAAIIPILLVFLAMLSGLWASASLYIIVMLLILIKPAGLFGKETVKKV